MNKKILLAGSGLLILILFFFCQGPKVNNWEISKPESPFKQIIFFGDSLTSGYGLNDDNESFPTLIGKNLNLPIKIYGYPGNTTADGLKKLPRLKDEKPSLLILTLGGNDILHRAALEDTESHLKSIISQLQSWGHTVVYTEVLSIMDGKRHLMHTNLCRERKVCMVPDILSGMITDQKLMQADSIHPNKDGCKLIAQRIIKVLKEKKFFN